MTDEIKTAETKAMDAVSDVQKKLEALDLSAHSAWAHWEVYIVAAVSMVAGWVARGHLHL